MFLKHHGGNLTVDFGAGQLFQQLGAIARLGIKEGGKLPLREQHRAGKAPVVQPGERGGLLQLIRHFVGQDFAIFAARQLHAGRLQVTVRLVARPVLAPEGAIGDAFYLELHFRQTFGGVAGHQVILRLGDFIQARRFVIKRQTDGVEQGSFTCPGCAGDGKQPVAGKRLSGKVNFPLALEGVEIFQAQAQNFHAFSSSSLSACRVWLNSSLSLARFASSISSCESLRSNTSSTPSSLSVSR